MAGRFLDRHLHASRAGDVRSTTATFSVARPRQQQQAPRVRRADLERESDARRLQQRQKQIDIGKKSEAYKRYLQLVPKATRRRRDPRHPCTPDIHKKCSKRGFDGQVKAWRKQLHTLFSPKAAGASGRVGGEGGASRERDESPGPANPPSDLAYIFATQDEANRPDRDGDDVTVGLYDGLF